MQTLGGSRGSRIVASLSLALALSHLPGCGGAQRDGGGEAWSSKSQSASGRDRGESEIPVPANRAAADDGAVLARPAPRAAGQAVDAAELRRAALDVAREASANASAILRAHAIEALTAAPSELDSVVGRGLIDANRGVRFAAAMAIARAKRTELAHLVEPLLQDPSESVRAAALAALAVCDRRPDLSSLAGMVRSNDPEVRANAYLALGTIGNPSAIPLVRETVGRGFDRIDPARVKIVDLQAAECLVRLGRTEDLEPIRAALFAPMEEAEVTALACQMIGRLHDGHSRPMLQRLIEADRESARPPEVRLAAIEALAAINANADSAGPASGDDRLLPAIQPFVQSRQASLRAQACMALGATRAKAALAPLDGLLRDADPVVRVAAAYAILDLTAKDGARQRQEEWMTTPPPQRF